MCSRLRRCAVPAGPFQPLHGEPADVCGQQGGCLCPAGAEDAGTVPAGYLCGQHLWAQWVHPLQTCVCVCVWSSIGIHSAFVSIARVHALTFRCLDALRQMIPPLCLCTVSRNMSMNYFQKQVYDVWKAQLYCEHCVNAPRRLPSVYWQLVWESPSYKTANYSGQSSDKL